MDFQFSEELRLLRETARKIGKNEFAPRAAEIDEKAEFPWDNKSILQEHGLLGITCPAEYGGSELGMLALAMTVETLAAVCASTAHIISTQSLVCDAFILKGTEEQKAKWLTPLATGSSIGAIAITEPNAGSDVMSISTTATRKNDGYVINGYKRFITHGTSADIVIVVAYTDKSKAHKGISLLVVPADTPGFTRGKVERKMGLRGSDTADLVFEECFVPEENLIGAEGEGFKLLMEMLNHSRLAIAAEGVGIASGALEAAIDHIRTREQFGKPLAQFQGLQWVIADMALKVELARTMLYRVCSVTDNDPHSEELPRLAAMAKWFASDTAMQVTTSSVQLFGGYGYSKEYPVERMMRDAKITQIYEGTNEICRIIVSRHVLK
ncbi:MAG: acyl-CoA dehydrogenase family protein [Deltaproteobacteria bacterium]